MKTYVFTFEVEQDEDGIWEAEIPVLPGCAVWGYTRHETLDALQECAQAYLEVKVAHGDALPPNIEQVGLGTTAVMLSITPICSP